jgi:hypothetical protein
LDSESETSTFFFIDFFGLSDFLFFSDLGLLLKALEEFLSKDASFFEFLGVCLSLRFFLGLLVLLFELSLETAS